MPSTEIAEWPRADRSATSEPLTVIPSARVLLRGLLRRVPLPLPSAFVDRLVSSAQITNWRAGQRILGPEGPSDIAHLLVSGAVRLDVTIRRRSSTLAFVPPGRFVGPIASPPAAPLPFVAIAHVPCLVAIVSHQTVGRALETTPEILSGLLSHELSRFQELAANRVRSAHSPLHDRLAAHLDGLASDFGTPVPEGILIDLPLIHEDLAKLVVASRANVTRALGDLRRNGRIAVVAQRIVVPGKRPVS